jgi:copper chaperone NosL
MRKDYSMQNSSRYLILLSCLLMVSAYFLPVWKIILEAPQYPEGLGMKIWLTGLTGNIDQINGLNHYIGMKHIVEDNFWEFKVIPYVFAIVIAIGLFAAYLNNRKWLLSWLIILILFAIAAFVDFYIWEYDYGHNLDPTAAIKVEGMSYQPPLIGYKQLLNFLAGSLPDLGGYLVGLGGLLAVWVLYKELRVDNTKINI